MAGVRARFAITALLMTFLVCASEDVSADDTAQAVFKEGVEEMMAGNFASGCPKIAEAHRLTKGAGALFTLAECHAKWDKPATAIRHYRAYLKTYAKLPADARQRQDERAKLATTQIAALAVLVPKLTIVMPDELAAGATVTVDGDPLTNDALNSALPLEVGPHRVVVTAADGRTAVHEFELTEGVERRWEVKLKDKAKPAVEQPPPPDGSPWTSSEVAGVIIGATGVAILAVGGVTGGLAMGERSTADEHCVERVCDSEGLGAIDSGKTLGDVSTATLVIGGVGVVAGLVLFLVGGDDSTETVGLTPRGLRLTF